MMTMMRSTGWIVSCGLLVAAAGSMALAQEKPTSGAASTVVYVSGNDLVIKAASGKLLNYTVPAGTKFSADGKNASLAELKPGTKLTAAVSTGFDPQVVSGIAVVKGKVYAVTPPDGVTLLLSEGVKELAVPAGTTFTVDGKAMKLGELKPDMMVDATVVTTGDATVASATATPVLVGALLVAKTGAADDMPSAGTSLPLYGLVGLVLIGLGIGMRMVGRKGLRVA
jgi:hypothetical protein